MSLFGEFYVPSEALALHDTLRERPNATVEIERVIATEELLTPYFWASAEDLPAFEAAAHADPTVGSMWRLDEFEEATLYRAEWNENVEAIIYAYLAVGAAILEATGQGGEWELRMRFDDQAALSEFRDYCRENGVPFELTRLFEVAEPQSGRQYGLTPRQYEALTTAWEMGYYDDPREVTLREVADELDITEQSLSDLLRRAYEQFICHALVVTPPDDDESTF